MRCGWLKIEMSKPEEQSVALGGISLGFVDNGLTHCLAACRLGVPSDRQPSSGIGIHQDMQLAS